MPTLYAALLATILGAHVPTPPEGTPCPNCSTDPNRVGVSVADAVEMVRIEDRYGTDQRFATISPDGTRVATLVWRGDLGRDVNLFSLLVIDLEEVRAGPATVDDAILTVSFDGDSLDQAATPIGQLSFLDDNRTVVFIGTLDGEPRQVYTIETGTGQLSALTGHPTDVTAYAVSGGGSLKGFSAISSTSVADLSSRLRTDGVFPYDPSQFRTAYRFAAYASVYGSLFRAISERGGLQHFRSSPRHGGEPILVGTGRQPPPLEAFGLGPAEATTLQGPLISRRPLRPSSVPEAFNPYRPVVFDGRVAVGVTESLTEPPELALHDFATGETTTLTDLNPRLRERTYGEVEQLRFASRYDSVSTGWLIKPVGFTPDHEYPLVVLHSNQSETPADRSFLIDGRHNLSGHAAQPLAGLGFVVLFLGTPPGRVGTTIEASAMLANTEAAIRALADRGYVDTLRIGVSGFSRSAYYTDHLLMHSTLPFAAGTQIDGGTAEYLEGMRPYRDDELARVRAPLLVQAHGPIQLAYQGRMADRLRAMGRSVEVLYFQTAPHSTKQPGHRLRSLSTHVDWWRFWLQDHEDAAPEKGFMYERWRRMRTGSAPPGPPHEGVLEGGRTNSPAPSSRSGERHVPKEPRWDDGL